MSRSDADYLRHVLDEAMYLINASDRPTWTEFAEDETLKRAFVRSIEVIGEATKNLSDTTREEYSGVQWRAMAGMRDRLIHGYFGVDYEIVGEVATKKAPELADQVEAILQEIDAA